MKNVTLKLCRDLNDLKVINNYENMLFDYHKSLKIRLDRSIYITSKESYLNSKKGNVMTHYIIKNNEDNVGLITVKAELNKIFIFDLIIDKDYRGMGISKSLLNDLKNKYKNIELYVFDRNTRAINFYNNIGMKHIERQGNMLKYSF